MTPQTLALIAQLLQLVTAEVPNVVKIVSLLRDTTQQFETMLSEADKTELAEIEKLKGQIR
jgi:hypothetical protein